MEVNVIYDKNAVEEYLDGLTSVVNDMTDFLDDEDCSNLDLGNFDGSISRANRYCNNIIKKLEELEELFAEFNNWEK